jgi:D-glycero-D-manno-heptose 1,7-bisphosphate phosphatase
MRTGLTCPLRSAVFLDKGETLLENVSYNIDPACMRFAPRAAEALALLAGAGFRLIIVSNQRGVAHGRFSRAALLGVEMRLREMFAACAATLEAAYWCPHDPAGCIAPYARACDCQKPQPGLLLRAGSECRVDLARSWMVGDILDDIEAGNRAGCRAILADCGNETEWQSAPERLPFAIVSDLYEAAQIIVEHDAYERQTARWTHEAELP